jgi:hypothetical protein
MTPKPVPLLAALALVALALATVPAASAGSAAHPEIDDGNDDVSVNGLCSGGFDPNDPCPSHDFVWPGADLDYAYVSDTADALLLTIGLKAGTGFKTAAPAETVFAVDYDYTFGFTAGGAPRVATAHFPHGGTITPGGAATVATVDSAGKELTLTVPKAAVGDVGPGDLLTGLYCQVDGKGSSDFTLSDRAPNANYGLDYTVANGTSASKVVRTTLSGARASITQSFAKPTNATYVYNWTSPAANLTMAYGVQVRAGSVDITIATAANQTLQDGTFVRSAAGNLTLTGAAGPLVVTLVYKGFNGTVSLQFAAAPPAARTTTTAAGSTSTTAGTAPPSETGGPTTVPNGFTFTPSTTAAQGGSSSTGSTTRSSPAAGGLLVAAALGAALLLVRRRL